MKKWEIYIANHVHIINESTSYKKEEIIVEYYDNNGNHMTSFDGDWKKIVTFGNHIRKIANLTDDEFEDLIMELAYCCNMPIDKQVEIYEKLV